jgi:hypothetical protein
MESLSIELYKYIIPILLFLPVAIAIYLIISIIFNNIRGSSNLSNRIALGLIDKVLVCYNCGHSDLFRYDDKSRNWTKEFKESPLKKGRLVCKKCYRKQIKELKLQDNQKMGKKKESESIIISHKLRDVLKASGFEYDPNFKSKYDCLFDQIKPSRINEDGTPLFTRQHFNQGEEN